MNAILLFLGSIGFACLPPGDAPVATPYTGPFAMPVNEALRYQLEWNARHPGFEAQLQVVNEDDPNFPGILARCPPLY
jgi:hypothetical protein